MNNNNGASIAIGVVIVAVIIVGGYFIFRPKPEAVQADVVPMQAVVPQATPSENSVAEAVTTDQVPASDNDLAASPAAVAPAASHAVDGEAPGVITAGASSISGSSAVLNGILTTNDSQSYYSFQFGPSTALGYSTPTAPIDGSTRNLTVSLASFYLQPATIYYYRLIAQNQFGDAVGSMMSFQTLGTVAPNVMSEQTVTTVSTVTH